MDLLWFETRRAYRIVDRLLRIAQTDVYPLAGEEVDGLAVRSDVPNTGSISASFEDFKILPGIREVSISDFSPPSTFFYAKNDWEQSRSLARAIAESGEISPLIVAIDEEGPYILEGAHRFVALAELGKTSFPALVVIGQDQFENQLDTAADGGYNEAGEGATALE